MGKARVARTSPVHDPYGLHSVSLALSRARALAWTLEQLGERGYPNDLLADLARIMRER